MYLYWRKYRKGTISRVYNSITMTLQPKHVTYIVFIFSTSVALQERGHFCRYLYPAPRDRQIHRLSAWSLQYITRQWLCKICVRKLIFWTWESFDRLRISLRNCRPNGKLLCNTLFFDPQCMRSDVILVLMDIHKCVLFL